jgi:cell division protein FtsQ
MKTMPVAALRRRLPRVSIRIPRKYKRRFLGAILLALALTAVYRFWFRESSFVSVQHVSVSGLTTPDAPRIRTALIAAAHDMTTMNVQQSALDGAVAGFPIVRTLEAQASFPHTLKIHVIEEKPTAVLAVGGERLLLAPDGSVLRGVTTGHPLPLIQSDGNVPQNSLTDRVPLEALHVAGAAPDALLGRITTIGHGKEGILVHLRNGPELIFGDDSRPVAKWVAVAAVLANASSKGATFVDVRLPDRPIAGGVAAETLAPLTSTGTDASPQSDGAAGGTTGTTGTTGATAPQNQSADGQPPTANSQPSGGP